MDLLTKFCELAVDMGAVDAKLIGTDQIVIRNWVRWKCRFGCPNYGKCFTCPPYTPTPQEMRNVLDEYSVALFFRYESSTSENLAFKLERQIFLEGYPAAFALTSGSCKLCSECRVETGHCVKPVEARPSMESCGISVFETANNVGYKLEMLTSKDQNYLRYGLVLLT